MQGVGGSLHGRRGVENQLGQAAQSSQHASGLLPYSNQCCAAVGLMLCMLTSASSFLGSCCDFGNLLSGLHYMLRCHCLICLLTSSADWQCAAEREQRRLKSNICINIVQLRLCSIMPDNLIVHGDSFQGLHFMATQAVVLGGS